MAEGTLDHAHAASPSASPHLVRSLRVVFRWRLAPAALMVLIAIFGPLLTPREATVVVAQPSLPPSGTYWFGTDQNGMDIFSRVIAGARSDLSAAALATVIATAAGLLIGVLAGTNESRGGFNGLLARLLARVLDMLDAVPTVIVGLLMVALFEPSLATIIAAISVVCLPRQAKLIRAEALKVRSEPYVDAARLSGAREASILLRTVLPNCSRPALENMSAIFGVAIILEAALGFLGVGLPPPSPEWGSMISLGASEALNRRWWGATFPTAALVLSVVGVALAGSEFLRPERP